MVRVRCGPDFFIGGGMRNSHGPLTVVAVLLSVLVSASSLIAQSPRDFAVDLNATVSNTTPYITLSWSIRRQGNITAQKIHRRLKGETTWVKQDDLTTNQISFADGTALPGIEYEYWMERTYTGIYPTTAVGYLSAGVNVPMAETRGTLLLVIDSTMATALAPEIEQLKSDLAGDGWTVKAIIALRTDTAVNVKAQIKAAYDADPTHVKMVYLLGHVPVPYSGNIAPDGHSNHVGAWPADGYYGDMDGTWTDTSVNNTSASDSRNDNIPSDGKFDQNYFPSLLELMVGRVDLQGMTRAPSSSVSETSLLRRYLKKAHDYRFKQGAYASVSRRSMVRDGFGYFGGENFAIAGWSWFFTGVGTQVDEPGNLLWFDASYAGGKSYLVGHGNGGGSYEYATSVGNSSDFGRKTSKVVFTSLFGSYFGDWDIANNFLRAPLAGNATGDSLGLTCFWGGRPNMFTHHMGLGETAGYSMWISQNGSLTGGGSYTPNNYAGVHTGLMGDPALRLHVVEPPRGLTATSAGSQISLAWAASSESGLQGYHVYRADTNAGPFTRLTSAPLSGTVYTDAVVTAGQSYSYLVRTLKLETAPGGTYTNLSVGALITLAANAGATAAPNSPGNLSVTPYSATNAVLTWTDTSSNETGFRIERKTHATGAFSSLGTVAANVSTFVDPGVFTSGTVYFYRVVATGASGDSVASQEASFEAIGGFFDLSATKMKVAKSTGVASIMVNRFGGANGAVSVNYATSDSSALAGTHYTAASGTLTWANGETNAKIVSVTLLTTAAPQPARQFRFALSSPSSGTGLGVYSGTAVLIEDANATLAAPWSQTILGGITDYSSAVLVDGVIGSTTMGGSGVSSSTTSEAGRFVYQSKTGDGIMTAYFPAGIPSDGGARYAVMVRASTASTAIMAAAASSSSTAVGSFLAARSTAGGYPSITPGTANTLIVARWMRLSRAGNVFTAETSADGTAWTVLGSTTLASMPSTALWGVFHYSSDWASTSTYSGNYHLAFAQNVSLIDLPVPTMPTGLVAVATSASSAALTWGTVGNAAGYRVERCTEGGSFTLVADMASGTGTTQTYSDYDVLADAAYAYRVTAYNASGSSDPSAVAYVTMPSADVVTLITSASGNGADATVRRDLSDTPLGLQTNLCVAGYDPDTWSFLTNAAKTYLRFDLSGTTNNLRSAKLKLSFIGASRFEDAGFYSLVINLLADGSDAWAENAITWANAPQNYLSGSWFSGSYVEIGGDDTTTSLPSAGEVVSFDLNVSSLNSNRGSNNQITIGICDYNGGALTEWASREHPGYAAPTLELGAPSPLPNRPSFFTATLVSGWKVSLNWQESATNETALELERRIGDGEFTVLQTLPSNTRSYVDAGISAETTYAYRLRTVSASGTSSWTPVVTVTTPDVFHAVGTVWDAGGGSDTSIDTAGNWDTDGNPSFDGTLCLNFASAGTLATINTHVSLLGLNLHRDADFTIADGGGTLTLGESGLYAVAPNATPRSYTLAAKVAFASNQTWCVTNTGSGTTSLTITGPLTDGDSTFGLTKTGNGLLTLAGASSYDGTTVVSAGSFLRVAHAYGLGSVVGNTVVMDGGWLEIAGGVAVVEPLRLNGAASLSGSGALRSVAGTNAWTGAVTLGSATRIKVIEGSALTLAGGLGGNYAVYLTPDAEALLSVTGLPLNVGSSTVYAYGDGTVAFGATGNAWGTLDVQGLTVRMDVSNALPSSSILSVGGSYSASGTVDLNGNSQTVSQLKRGTANAGARIVTSVLPATLTVSGSSSTTYDGVLAGALSFVKGGSSTLTLGGTNLHTGATTVSGGTLTVNVGSSLVNSTNIYVTGGTLRILGTACVSDAATLSIADGAKVYMGAGLVETVNTLVLSGGRKAKGTWGSSSSGAEHVDDAHFSGTGVVYVPTGTSSAWDGGGANTFINNSSNWDYDTTPALDGSAYLSFGVGGAVATINTNVGLLGFCINRDADFTVADGGGTLTLGGSGLCAVAPKETPQSYTLSAQVVFACDQTWCVTNTGSGTTSLTITGPLTDGDSTFGLTKTGDGLLTLAGASSYDGTTVVGTGTYLRVAHAYGLGSVVGNTVVMDGGWLEIAGGVAVVEPLRLNGAASLSGAGALRSVVGTNAWTGAVTLGSAARIRVVVGSALTLAGGLGGNYAVYLTPDEGALLSVTGLPITVGSSTVYAYGAGTVAFGATGNAWGTLDVQGLTVRMDVSNALPATSILSLGGTYSVGGTVDLNGKSQTVSQLKRGTANAGARIVTSVLPATLTVNGSTSTTYDGVLAGAVSLTKSGSSTLTLGGTNLYTGATTVSGGTLTVNIGAALLGSGDISVTSGTLKLFGTSTLPDTAVLRIADGGGAKVYVGAGLVETVGALHLGTKGARRGTWGASGSGATNIDSVHFSGTGTINVSQGPETLFIVR
jgi:autotransporter-associated beta strand protein